MDQFKCAYCKWILKYDQLAQHFCFADTSVDSLVMNNERNIFVQENENIEDACNKNRLDKDFITAIQNRPALYDFRLLLKQRERKQKDDLWKISLYTPSEAEKRWNYLKNCYKKARNLFKKQQALQQRSGSAGISKSESIMSSLCRHTFKLILKIKIYILVVINMYTASNK